MSKDIPWTRATTVASTLADRYGLEQWAQRNTVLGIGLREDLYAQAAAATPDDKETLGQIVKQAQEAAKAKAGANIGTMLHKLTDRVDAGEEFHIIPPWKDDIDAYRKTIKESGIGLDPIWIERVVVVPQLRIAGTLDRIATLNGQYFIADLKSGQDVVKYKMPEIAIQLAIYAGASHMWLGDADSVPRDHYGRYKLPDPADSLDMYEPMPPVSRERALVIHLPAGQARCELHWVDIAAGREAVRTAVWVREWRKRRDLSEPFIPTKEAANF